MVKFHLHSYQLPRWIVPVMALAALALIPFALVLAITLAVLAMGASLIKTLMIPSSGIGSTLASGLKKHSQFEQNPASIIDADFEIKDENEKADQR